MWNKSGNFQRSRSVNYMNRNRDTIIKTIFLSGQHDGDFRISVKARNHRCYEQLVQHTIRAGFPIPERIDQNGMMYTLTTSDRAAITNFIKAVKALQADFVEIEPEFCDILAINLQQEQPSYAWIRSGNFHSAPRDVLLPIRRMTYVSSTPDSGIRKLELHCDPNCNLSIFIKVNNNILCENLKFALITEDFSSEIYNMNSAMHFSFLHLIEDPTNHIYIKLEYAIDRPEKMHRLLAVLGQFSNTFSEISNQIFTEVINIQEIEPPRRPLARGFFTNQARMNLAPQESLPTTENPLDFGENARKLNALQFSGEISETYQCSLNNEIMTDPVYDPSRSNQKFEKLSIYRALDEKQENPFTRQALTKAALVLDEELKNEINSFLNSIIESRNLPPVLSNLLS